MSAAAEPVAEATKPRRVRGPRKSTLAALDAARREGYEMGRREAEAEADGAPRMLATVIVWASGVVFGAILGVWLF